MLYEEQKETRQVIFLPLWVQLARVYSVHNSKNIKHRIIEADGILRMQIVVSRAYRPAGLVTH